MLRRIHQAERLRGCVFHEDFASAADIAENGGVVTGALSFDTDKGAYFDGVNDRVEYSATKIVQPFSAGFVGIRIELRPNRAADAAETETLFSSADNAFSVYRTSTLLIFKAAGGNAIVTPVAAYSPYWIPGTRVVLEYTGKAAANVNTLRINGVQVDAEVNNWTPANITSLIVGSGPAGASPFSGYIRSVDYFKHPSAAELLTAGEALSAFNRDTFTYQSRATCILPMGAAQHDAVGNRTLDVSGKGNHFTLGDGVTATTFPTKLATRGYSFDGGDWLTALNMGVGNYSPQGLSVCALFKAGASASQQMLAGKSSSAGVAASEWQFPVQADASVRGTVYLSPASQANATTAIGANNALRFCCFSIAPSSLMLVFDGRSFVYGASVVASWNTNLQLLKIGCRSSDNGLCLTGEIRYFSLYPFALTPTQIAAEYYAALSNARMT